MVRVVVAEPSSAKRPAEPCLQNFGGIAGRRGCQGRIWVFLVCILAIAALSERIGLGESKPADSSAVKAVKKPVFADDRWYSSNPDTLARDVDGYISGAKSAPKTEGRLLGLIAPHAAYVYSGPVAGCSYRCLKECGQPVNTVILIGPSHRFPLDRVSVNNVQDYETPLGVVQNDRELGDKVIAASGGAFRYQSRAHEMENSLETQLPFLQRSLPSGFRIVPILINDTSQSQHLASILKEAVTRRGDVIVIASSDMSHYKPYEQANRIDGASLTVMESLDVAALRSGLDERKIELCGGAAVLTLEMIAKELGAQEMKRLCFANSGDTAGGKDAVVGYCSHAVFVPVAGGESKKRSTDMEGMLSDDEKRHLLKLARDTITEYVGRGRVPEFETSSPDLLKRQGAFVTIKRQGMLRGCIGRFSPVSEPLYKIVQKMAIAAATQDTRFRPMSRSETSDMTLEISVLSDLKEIDDIDEIQVGVHGLEIAKGPYRGVLLPQVATEHGWDRKTFLEQTCRKAGLPQNAYITGAKIYVFSAQVFGEEDLAR